jgi:N-methylhydantoinase B/oxoprolinase/acetone carboxylase alpha subunit
MERTPERMSDRIAKQDAKIAALREKVKRLNELVETARREVALQHSLWHSEHSENEQLREAMTGWEGYGWKNDVYIDSLDSYFRKALRGEVK